MPPPIPENLHGRECVYGYTISDAFMRAYFEAHSVGEPEPPRTSYLWLPYKHYWLEHVARRVGLDLHLRVEQQQLPTLPEDIMYFSYTRYGAIKRKIPKMQYLKRFENELGLTEPPKWHDAGIPLKVYFNNTDNHWTFELMQCTVANLMHRVQRA
jgi:hypothetical protein